MRYLLRNWSQREEIHDPRQKSTRAVYESAAKSPLLQPKPFLSAAARHLLADRARRARVVSIEPMGDFEPSNVLVDDLSPNAGAAAGRSPRLDAFDRRPTLPRGGVAASVEDLSQKPRSPCGSGSVRRPWKAHRQGHATDRRGFTATATPWMRPRRSRRDERMDDTGRLNDSRPAGTSNASRWEWLARRDGGA